MKIAFWSNAGGNSGVTSNLACISVASAMEYSYKSILIENHYQKNKLENVLRYNRANYHLCEEDNDQIKHIGMNYVMNQLSNGKFESQIYDQTSKLIREDKRVEEESKLIEEASKLIEEASIEILSNILYCIPTSNGSNIETFEYDIYGSINHILKVLDSFADITYIDTSNKHNLSSKIILEEVDLVVVNLVQNSSMIQNFFENYSSILSKCVFLISSYHKESSININNISKTHFINKSTIATIPFNVEYQEAVIQGTIVEFLSRNYTCKRTNPNYNFVHAVKKAVYMIYNNLELSSHKEKCL